MIQLTDEQKAQAVADILAEYEFPLRSFIRFEERTPAEERHCVFLSGRVLGMATGRVIQACEKLGIAHGFFEPTGRWDIAFSGVVLRVRDVHRLNNHLWPPSQK